MPFKNGKWVSHIDPPATETTDWHFDVDLPKIEAKDYSFSVEPPDSVKNSTIAEKQVAVNSTQKKLTTEAKKDQRKIKNDIVSEITEKAEANEEWTESGYGGRAQIWIKELVDSQVDGTIWANVGDDDDYKPQITELFERMKVWYDSVDANLAAEKESIKNININAVFVEPFNEMLKEKQEEWKTYGQELATKALGGFDVFHSGKEEWAAYILEQITDVVRAGGAAADYYMSDEYKALLLAKERAADIRENPLSYKVQTLTDIGASLKGENVIPNGLTKADDPLRYKGKLLQYEFQDAPSLISHAFKDSILEYKNAFSHTDTYVTFKGIHSIFTAYDDKNAYDPDEPSKFQYWHTDGDQPKYVSETLADYLKYLNEMVASKQLFWICDAVYDKDLNRAYSKDIYKAKVWNNVGPRIEQNWSNTSSVVDLNKEVKDEDKGLAYRSLVDTLYHNKDRTAENEGVYKLFQKDLEPGRVITRMLMNQLFENNFNLFIHICPLKYGAGKNYEYKTRDEAATAAYKIFLTQYALHPEKLRTSKHIGGVDAKADPYLGTAGDLADSIDIAWLLFKTCDQWLKGANVTSSLKTLQKINYDSWQTMLYRADGITIPGISRKQTSSKFVGLEIPAVGGSFDQKMEMTINFRLDRELAMLFALGNMSGASFNIGTATTEMMLSSLMNPSFYKRYAVIISTGHFGMADIANECLGITPTGTKEIGGFAEAIDENGINVRHSDKIFDISENLAKTISTKHKHLFHVFNDVKFTGFGQALSFENVEQGKAESMPMNATVKSIETFAETWED